MGATQGLVRGRLILALLLLAVAPGCRVIAGAAVIVGEAFLEGAIDSALDDDGDDDCDAPKQKHRASGPRRAPAAPRDPSR